MSPLSRERLKTCHVDLQRLIEKVDETWPVSVLEGHRDEYKQNKAFKEGFSKLQWPHGKHNRDPSIAIDVLPYPADYSDWKRNYFFMGFVKAVAQEMGIKIRLGCDWDSDFNFKEETFVDMPHVELLEK